MSVKGWRRSINVSSNEKVPCKGPPLRDVAAHYFKMKISALKGTLSMQDPRQFPALPAL